LLDAGLTQLNVSVSDIGGEYERVYKLPFERTRDNVVRFLDSARGRCEVVVIVVDHHGDPPRRKSVVEFWRSLGVRRFIVFGLCNRAGSLDVDETVLAPPTVRRQAQQHLEELRVRPICGAPFLVPFVGYDGQYYLCGSDWQKEVPLGSVFERSIAELTQEKLGYVESREPICNRCSSDPVNLLARSADGETLEQLLRNDAFAREFAASLRPI
jgi:hypothetical protein